MEAALKVIHRFDEYSLNYQSFELTILMSAEDKNKCNGINNSLKLSTVFPQSTISDVMKTISTHLCGHLYWTTSQ